MPLRNFLHAQGWHARLPHLFALPGHRGPQIAVALMAVGALSACLGLAALHDGHAFDAPTGAAQRRPSEALKRWQDHFANGLQVSLRAVADGRDTPPRTTHPLVAGGVAAMGAEAASPARR
jgi:hypothetical protein